MAITIEFDVFGEPVGKARPRVVNGHAYTPEKTRAYEQTVRLICKTKSKGVMFDKGIPVKVGIEAYYKIPKSVSQKVRGSMLSGETEPCKKPDVDNLAKIILDSLNGLVYHDDAQVTELRVRKLYSDNPHVHVTIYCGKFTV